MGISILLKLDFSQDIAKKRIELNYNNKEITRYVLPSLLPDFKRRGSFDKTKT